MELIENPLAQVVDANNHTTTKYKARDGRISQSQSHSSIANDRSPSGGSNFLAKSPGSSRRDSGGGDGAGSLPSDPLLTRSQPSPESHKSHPLQSHILLNFTRSSHPDGDDPGGKSEMRLTSTSVCSREGGDVVVVAHRTSSPSNPSHNANLPLQSQVEDRETWSQGLDFLLSIIGFAVDLANVWRFPYFCYKNGGGAFLIPYFLMLALSAIPVFYMELLLGQFIRQGPISMWKICPLFKGIGYCAVTVSYFVSFYYNTIMGWSLHFTINSFTSPLPWTTCNNSWNTENCFIPEAVLVHDDDNSTSLILGDENYPPDNLSLSQMSNWHNENSDLARSSRRVVYRPPNATSPASEYFRNSVLEMGSHDIDNLGLPKMDLLLCLAAIYIFLFLILLKSIRSTGKVVWVTATMPYFVLSILLVRGLMLEGASDGIYYYLVPNMTKLREVEVWSDAAKQIFFSSGAGFGVHLTYASYNNFHNNCFRDCMVTSMVNCFTSIFAGFVIFTFLGSMAYRQGRPIEEVVNVGPGLVFEVYPEAVGSLPGANFWSLIFFLALLSLGLDSAMGGIECVVTGITDEFKAWFKRWKFGREVFTFFIVFISFLISIINVTRGGMYTFIFFDTYAAGSSLLFAVVFEVLVVSWVYGLDQFCKDAESMLGFAPGIYWKICWKYISPLLISVIIVLDLSTALPLTYDGYLYPTWAQNMGYIFTFIPITLVPIIALREFFKFPGNCKSKLSYAITPTNEHPAIKNEGYVKRFMSSHWVGQRRGHTT
ncbi:sodium-dependent noradrenaline transporter isoform X1 [Folsomia candida]|uniref:sodium-dependent noradrenaline transporter isoform X1 n=2 Tax=Folsomia candida TaxID=158441 RepID=UPI0016050B0B|nr:sodium-dependent noradrenaline transporter isoform X1 [Folsomia candida]XP_035703387.1 sodium-dependent noradrenaline transporter isoform X1 [Folsomia candida]XP_035703393.1 sodium-dependent noradrenaline transporter isoform X1 [Folsomia candida]XP_035703402.1 sodium-dependent noradrenaline transporter isoform X1 [Folsomia candida]